MGTRLEQLQAAAKAKTAAGQPLAPTPTTQPDMPKVATPSTAPGMKATGVGAMAGITSAIPKAAPSTPVPTTPVTAPTVGAMAGIASAVPKASPAPVAAHTAAPAAAAPTTNYVAQGGKTLNDILYLKGNYNASNKDYIAKQAAPLYAQLDPNTAAQVKGMNYDQLKAYIGGLGSQSSAPAAAASTEQAAPRDYRSLATAAYEQELAAMMAAAQAQETELNRRYDYANDVTQDNRQLRDASYYRNNAPKAWDGSTDYRTAMQGRQDSIEDHYTQEALTDAVGTAYSQANAFRNQSGNYISTKASELENADKQYNLQVADLTGVLNGQQTMQGKAAQASFVGQNIANQIAQIDLSTYPQQAALKLQDLQQQVQSGKISNDAAAYQLTQLTDPNSTTNQASALDLQMKQIDASNYSDAAKLQLEQLRKTVAEIGKTPYQSETDKELDQLNLQKAKLEFQKLQEGVSAETVTFEDLQSNIEKIVQRDKKNVITNPTTVEDYILNSNMSPYEMYRAYGVYGLKWEGAVPSKGE